MPSYDPMSDPKAPLFAGKPSVAWIGPDAEDRAEVHDDPAVDMAENDLHVGTAGVCPVCNQRISAGQAVRLRVDGMYQHDTCRAS
jgi:hypothetical protein